MTLAFWRRLLRGFARDHSGNAAVIVAIVMLPLFMVFGAAIDYTRVVHARSQMMAAVDAAAHAARRLPQIDPDTLQTTADQIFKVNMFDSGMEPEFDVDARYLNDGEAVRVDAAGYLPATILRALGHARIRIDVTREITVPPRGGLEVVMALDNSGGMEGAPIASLRRAALKLVDILLPGDRPSDTTRIALVPFVTAVNVRSDTLPGFESDPGAFSWDWIDIDTEALYHGRMLDDTPGVRDPTPHLVRKGSRVRGSKYYNCKPEHRRAKQCFMTFERDRAKYYNVNHLSLAKLIANARSLGGGWRGCVEARPGGLDMRDVPPGSPGSADYRAADTRWVPWFWPDEPDVGGHTNNFARDPHTSPRLWARQEFVGKYYAGHELNDLRKRIVAPPLKKYVDAKFVERGPNKGCPRPIVPLTNLKDVLVDEIEYMRPLHGSGRLSPTALIWGERALSPEPPYTQGEAFSDGAVRKVLILVAGGENHLFSDPGGQDYNLSDYSPYGFLSDNRLNLPLTTKEAFQTEMNERMASLCAQIKNRGVDIYMITVDAPSRELSTLFRNCASGAKYAFSANSSNLEDVFAKIGSDIVASQTEDPK